MRSRKEIFKRTVLFALGTFLMGLGIACTKQAELGVSPVSSVANVLSYKYDFFSLGSWLTIWNIVMIFAQLLIMGKSFKAYLLLQVPLSFALGWFTDIGMWLVGGIPAEAYCVKIALILIGIVIIGFGISFSVIADLIMNCGETLVKAIADRWRLNFGNVKTGFDIFCVCLSIVMSLLFFDFTIVGTREGTVISALLTGSAVRFCSKWLKEPIEKIVKS